MSQFENLKINVAMSNVTMGCWGFLVGCVRDGRGNPFCRIVVIIKKMRFRAKRLEQTARRRRVGIFSEPFGIIGGGTPKKS